MAGRKSVGIALQGGGSHGALTFGALARLTEQSDLSITSISGTSSGAVNGALLCQGMAASGESNRAAPLRAFWTELGDSFDRIFSPLPELGDLPFVSPTSGRFSLEWFLRLSETFAPYVFNPAALNPLRSLLEKHIDFELLRTHQMPHLFVSATNVRSGKLKVFERHEISAEHILASACLPSIHHAITIDGETYWDGGFAGNPPIYPLIFDGNAEDIIIILVNPINREDVPMSSDAIRSRMQEIAFNANFMREMRAITFSKRFVREHWGIPGALERKINRSRIHIIEAEAQISELKPNTRYNASSELIEELYDVGYQSCDHWLRNHGECIGKSETADLESMFE